MKGQLIVKTKMWSFSFATLCRKEFANVFGTQIALLAYDVVFSVTGLANAGRVESVVN